MKSRNLAISVFLCFMFLASPSLRSQDSTRVKERIKKGWDFMGLPVIAYDADMGFQYGLLGRVNYFGDGSTYPEYLHSIYAEVSFFTKGSKVLQFFYDSKHLIPGKVRLTAELSYLTEKALDFYGFNGYEAVYYEAYADDESVDYISRVFYRHERKMLRAMVDFQGPLAGEKLRWMAGINFFDIRTATVDIERLNKGKKESKQLPDTTLLYDYYVDWGLLSEEEAGGGPSTCIKAGLVYDTRDNEPAPNRGIWSEALVIYAPEFLGTHPRSFTKIALTHRQYLSLVKRYLVLAYRLSYQGFLSGNAPYYILPYMFSSYALNTKPDGLGGAQSIRGVLRNRVVGDGYFLGNIELRWKFLRTIVLKQNFSLGLTGFLDGGMVVQPREVDLSNVPSDYLHYFDEGSEKLHLASGLGIRAAVNENFIIAIDYGFALDRRDGNSGLYVGVANLF